MSIGVASAALATAAVSTAGAEELSLSANVAMGTDYSFRGISQTDLDPTIQGGFDAGYGIFYIGTWASNISFAGGTEIDLYAGITPTLGPLDLDLGVIYYAYPSASDDGAETDYIELAISAGHDFGPFSASIGLNYSPDYTLESGDFFYPNGGVSIPVFDSWSIDGTVGYNIIDDEAAFGTPDYVDYSVGISYSYEQFTGTVSWVDTDLDDSECFGGADPEVCDGRVILSLSASF
ncbi:MAG: hypothetical protein H6923_04430 [Alphaproteobacteria bacterium]|nr:hypothetical protein [Alphaproteobacteria bacterium]